MKNNSGFNLISVIMIILATSVIASIATGVIMINNPSVEISNNKYNIEKDEELMDFIEVYQTLVEKYYDDIDKKGMLNAAEEAMTKFLGDKYTTYLNDKEYQEILDELSGEYNKIGLVINNNKIIKVLPMSASYKAGVMKNDLIVSINGANVENLNGDQISEIIKNDVGKELYINVYRNNENINLVITKDNQPSVSYQIVDNTSIGYMYLKSFSQNLSEQVRSALEDMEKSGMDSLIIDLRDNVGGYLSSAEETSSIFLEKGKTIYSLESNNTKYTYKDETDEKRTYKIVVLINNTSASAAEILASALKDSYHATLVGVKSYGKGKVQQVVSMNSGDSIKYTSAMWLTPSGICIDGIGIIPDYTIQYSETDGFDSQLTKAIELLK